MDQEGYIIEDISEVGDPWYARVVKLKDSKTGWYKVQIEYPLVENEGKFMGDSILDSLSQDEAKKIATYLVEQMQIVKTVITDSSIN